MQRYHINANNDIAVCRAKKGNCPYGESDHFDSMEEARKVAEERAKEEHEKGRATPSNEKTEKFYEVRYPKDTHWDDYTIIDGRGKLIDVAERLQKRFRAESIPDVLDWDTSRWREWPEYAENMTEEDLKRYVTYAYGIKARGMNEVKATSQQVEDIVSLTEEWESNRDFYDMHESPAREDMVNFVASEGKGETKFGSNGVVEVSSEEGGWWTVFDDPETRPGEDFYEDKVIDIIDRRYPGFREYVDEKHAQEVEAWKERERPHWKDSPDLEEHLDSIKYNEGVEVDPYEDFIEFKGGAKDAEIRTGFYTTTVAQRVEEWEKTQQGNEDVSWVDFVSWCMQEKRKK